ncbi:hypothetical protein FC81_GL000129 [Liquorilactobacillus capillatus DSM 19910]|uniref:SH3b domain-containing protein n=1 Tax=Liquorilactobacillus capillatus DSM 19910 TaxID=1423731 RepID=A0A0R1LX45_9LACO|nr:hypothetical protein FC81_GL000129 [Liquorilactobacillus capillatus DSM 19910]
MADIASYQPDTLSFFHVLRTKGVRAVIVKLTEGSANGSAYINPKAANQIKSARQAGLLVHAYHYAKFRGKQDAHNEADWFVQHARKLQIKTNSVLALDMEDEVNANPATLDANAFLQRVKAAGYPHVDIYSMASWFWTNRLNPQQLIAKNLWVANYGVAEPGVKNVGLWQYTSAFVADGVKLDMNYDFNGFYTKPLTAPQVNVLNKDQAVSFIDNLGHKWFFQQGCFITQSPIKLRWGAKTTSGIIAILTTGVVINYDAYSFHDGYVWLRQPRANNSFGYLASGEECGGRRISIWGSFKQLQPLS